MKPLPKDEQNPLAAGATLDHLVLWLAYKEVKAITGFVIDDGTQSFRPAIRKLPRPLTLVGCRISVLFGRSNGMVSHRLFRGYGS